MGRCGILVSTNGIYLRLLTVHSSNIPLGVSVLLKEKYLKARNVDVWYFRAWLAVFELLCGLLYFPSKAPHQVVETFNM